MIVKNDALLGERLWTDKIALIVQWYCPNEEGSTLSLISPIEAVCKRNFVYINFIQAVIRLYSIPRDALDEDNDSESEESSDESSEDENSEPEDKGCYTLFMQ